MAVSDGKPGHRNQLEGLRAALARQTPLITHWLDAPSAGVSLFSWLSRRFPAGAALPAPTWVAVAGHSTHLAGLAARRADGERLVVLMRPSLPLPSFPLTAPFSAMGYAEAGYVPGAAVHSSTLIATGNNAIVDWVIVEMRPAATPNVVAASRAVLLQRDGDVVDLDGVSTVGFAGLAHGNYCVAVKTRTHLPVMLSASAPFAYGISTAVVDFTAAATQVHDNDGRKSVSGVMVLATGDATFNEELSYVGNGNDRDPILLRIGGSAPSATVTGYWPEDVNMDGVVKYVGANNDRDPILVNVGGSTPTATRNAQLP